MDNSEIYRETLATESSAEASRVIGIWPTKAKHTCEIRLACMLRVAGHSPPPPVEITAGGNPVLNKVFLGFRFARFVLKKELEFYIL